MDNILKISNYVFHYSTFFPSEISVCKKHNVEAPKEAVFDREIGTFVKSNSSNGFDLFTERELKEVEKIINENQSIFHFERQKKYLVKPRHVTSLNLMQIAEMQKDPFFAEPDFDSEVRLWLNLQRYDGDANFDRSFVIESLRPNSLKEEEVEKWAADFKEEYYADGHDLSEGWEALGDEIIKIYSIEDLEDIYIVKTILNRVISFDYIIRKNEGFRKVFIPGEFIGTSDFLFVQ